jgi:hypothetical protein
VEVFWPGRRRWPSKPIGESLEKSGYGLDAQHRAVVFVGQQVEQSVWTLPYFPDPLPQFAEQRFATQFFGVGVDSPSAAALGRL